MLKLLKISDYYYVIDDKAEIKESDYFTKYDQLYHYTKESMTEYLWSYSNNGKFNFNNNRCWKIIATTNPNLQLPQITNASDDMVDKEVEVDIYGGLGDEYYNNYCLIKILPSKKNNPVNNETLEEVADSKSREFGLPYFKKFGSKVGCGDIEAIHYEGFIAGYKHCEKTMYSEDEVLKLLHKITKLAITEPEAFCEGICYDSYKVQNWFNNNKK